MTPAQVGFIGLGHMGRPIASNLMKAGYALRAHDRDPQASSSLVLLNPQAAIVGNVADTVAPGGVVFSMVDNDASLMSIALRPDGIVSRLGAGGVHVSLSTISPELAEKLEPIYAEQGAAYVSAAVVGRPDVAEAARLTVYLSGAEEAKARVRPLLGVLGKVADLGREINQANIAKLATNSLILSAIAAMGEAAELIERSGGNPVNVLHIIAGTPLFSGAVYSQYGDMVGRRDFSDAQFPVRMGIKDAKLIIEAAARYRLEMPSTRHAYHALLSALAAGRDAEDWSVLSLYSPRSEAQALVS